MLLPKPLSALRERERELNEWQHFRFCRISFTLKFSRSPPSLRHHWGFSLLHSTSAKLSEKRKESWVGQKKFMRWWYWGKSKGGGKGENRAFRLREIPGATDELSVLSWTGSNNLCTLKKKKRESKEKNAGSVIEMYNFHSHFLGSKMWLVCTNKIVRKSVFTFIAQFRKNKENSQFLFHEASVLAQLSV